MAQRYFDQGLRLVYAFNHAEAIRSFREAQRHDPKLAMAWWGEALALGPNINDAGDADRNHIAHQAMEKARSLAAGATESERAFIDALAVRYSADKDADQKALNQKYAEAMAQVAARYPEDADALVLYAAALMETMPWNYWTKDGKPHPGTEDAIRAIESALAKHPEHAGANHYHIHIVEATDPDRAIPSAERLATLAPEAGHLVHMPGHIWIRVGRYDASAAANEKAVAADEAYFAKTGAGGLYRIGYYPHNFHFLNAAAALDGTSAKALVAARRAAGEMPADMSQAPSFAQSLVLTPVFTLVRFGLWDDILKEPLPGKTPFLEAIWHYARGMAYAGKKQLADAEKELAQLNQLSAKPELKDFAVGNNKAAQITEIAGHSLAGEIAARQGKTDAAVEHLRKAVAIEDLLTYDEPSDWPYPVRHWLGAVLLEGGRASEAESVYREDLRVHRENGWSLFGLMQSLKAQGKTAEAAEVETRFQQAWKRADVTLTASRF
jgi:tetratricopeptide (TPR) repeat protein